ncbi:MAG: hypothetical protein DWH79_08960 [Planctomycetota bacterium]|nr:MAG: hypothetical protein DWH79_08960 [Planctomycetota bacterium]
MPRPPHDDTFDTDDNFDDGGDGAGDSAADSGDEPTVPCPWCREEIFEDAVQCPACGKYLSDEDAPPPRKPWWVVAVAVLLLYVFVRTLFP